MKTTFGLILLLPLAALGAPHRQQAPGVAPAAGCPASAVAALTPSTLPATSLIAAVEEERMAHDLYVAAAARWDLRVFQRIARSETQHANTLAQLAANSGVALPPAKSGLYATAELQQLYASLLPLVNESEVAALKAAALVEETDIADLREAAAIATDDATRTVLANLERASGRHLNAFVRNLAARGVAYAPQVLAGSDYAALIVAREGRGGMRRGQGRGAGYGLCDGTGPGATGQSRGGR